MFNTAMGKMLDFIEPNFSPLVGQIKDILAGGVLLASIVAIIIGTIIFIPKILF